MKTMKKMLQGAANAFLFLFSTQTETPKEIEDAFAKARLPAPPTWLHH